MERNTMSRFIPDPTPVYTPEWKDRPDAELIVFCGRDMLLCPHENRYEFPRSADLRHWNIHAALRIGMCDGKPCYAVELPELPELPPEPVKKIAVRTAVGCLQDSAFSAGCRAKELLHWRRQHQYCGHCGRKLKESSSDVAMVCPECGEKFYPQLAPAIIVAVTRGDEILLAHNRNFLPEIYGLIAGFVEAGENLEEAIAREIMEETSITVGNIRYFSSQCWPFPNSLMLGFYADYVSGEAKPDGKELETLGWFRAGALPKIPPKGSIARRIIDDFERRHKQKETL